MSADAKPVVATVRSVDRRKHYVFWCPGCECAHQFTVPPWTYNGDPLRPTVRASILLRDGPTGHTCHMFVTNGKIRFLGDCSHDLRGTEVDMVPFCD